MSRGQGPTPWRQALRVVSVVDDAELRGMVISPELFSAAQFLRSSASSGTRLGILLEQTSDRLVGQKVKLGQKGVAGILVMERIDTTSADSVFVLHSLCVLSSCRGQGCASALLLRAYDCALAHHLGRVDAHAVKSTCSFRLAGQTCLRRWDILGLLLQYGWTITKDADMRLSPSDVAAFRMNSTPTHEMRLAVQGPIIDAAAGVPFLYPGVQRGLHLFKTPSELAPASAEGVRNRKSYEVTLGLLSARFVLSPSSFVRPIAHLGLLPFAAPLRACQLLEDYLSNPSHHSFESDRNKNGQIVVVHRLWMGDVSLQGYGQYKTLNGEHSAVLQNARTLRTSGRDTIEAAVRTLPGLADILVAGYASIGHGDALLSHMIQSVLHIHFLLLDKANQVDFGWHEDTWDVSAKESQREHMLSFITQLSATFTTAMQVMGFTYHEYGGQGAGVVFPSRALHRSVSRRQIPQCRAVWKVAVFVDPRAITAKR